MKIGLLAILVVATLAMLSTFIPSRAEAPPDISTLALKDMREVEEGGNKFLVGVVANDSDQEYGAVRFMVMYSGAGTGGQASILVDIRDLKGKERRDFRQAIGPVGEHARRSVTLLQAKPK